MSRYYPPTFNEKKFHCIFCNVYAQHKWTQLGQSCRSGITAPIISSQCEHCEKNIYWSEERMIIPTESSIHPAHENMPIGIIDEYNEARDIFSRSPRASAAILRLTLQKLMLILKEEGKSIDDDINSLVKKGLSIQVQKVLIYCRAIGSNAANPGEINIVDSPEIARSLFNMINYIIEDRIARPKKVDSWYFEILTEFGQSIDKGDLQKLES
jgi:hypothetical protein